MINSYKAFRTDEELILLSTILESWFIITLKLPVIHLKRQISCHFESCIFYIWYISSMCSWYVTQDLQLSLYQYGNRNTNGDLEWWNIFFFASEI